jgi:hypothetical protein
MNSKSTVDHINSYPSMQNIHTNETGTALHDRLIVQREMHIGSQNSSIDRVAANNRNLSLVDQELPEPTEDLETSLMKSELLRDSMGPATSVEGSTAMKASPLTNVSGDQQATS